MIALLILIFIFPILYVILGIIIKINSDGPVIFTQPRIGKDGKLFKIYKFRTMFTESDDEHEDDIIPFGHFMRNSHIDEIPQIINVLKNDMSIIGPRPHTAKDTIDFSSKIPYYNSRLTVKPGITGLAQVRGYSGRVTEFSHINGRVHYDIFYINHWSPGLDTYILLLTFRHFNAPSPSTIAEAQKWQKQTINA